MQQNELRNSHLTSIISEGNKELDDDEIELLEEKLKLNHIEHSQSNDSVILNSFSREMIKQFLII